MSCYLSLSFFRWIQLPFMVFFVFVWFCKSPIVGRGWNWFFLSFSIIKFGVLWFIESTVEFIDSFRPWLDYWNKIWGPNVATCSSKLSDSWDSQSNQFMTFKLHLITLSQQNFTPWWSSKKRKGHEGEPEIAGCRKGFKDLFQLPSAELIAASQSKTTVIMTVH